MKNYIKYIGILALGMVACEPEFENPVDERTDVIYSSGQADFSNYVALGNSGTAGYADGALYISAQETSFPNILAEQFAKAGGGEFAQPLMADNVGGLLYNGSPLIVNESPFLPRRVLGRDENGNPTPVVYTGAQPTTDIANKLSGYFNNMGVPGAKIFHLGAQGYGNVDAAVAGLANPYYARFSSGPAATVIGDALAQSPTFFSLWIGSNDVLSFATSGGVGVYQADPTVSPADYGSSDITNPMVFSSIYSDLVNTLIASGAEEGVLLSIPNVTDFPFFTTVPVNAIPLDGETASMLNANFQAYNEQILPGLVNAGAITAEEMEQRQISFSAGQNFVTLADENLTDISEMIQNPPFNLDPVTANLLAQLRQATSQDLIPLTSAGVLGTVVAENPAMIRGVSVPLSDELILTAKEQELITSATEAYNQTIEQIAQQEDLVFVDTSALLNKLSEGGVVTAESEGRVLLSSDFITGGAFSLDGIHLTPQGNAFLANRIIEKIEEVYDAELPIVNVSNYSTITTDSNLD